MNRRNAETALIEKALEFASWASKNPSTMPTVITDVIAAADTLNAIPLEIPDEPKVNTKAPLTAHWAAMSMRRRTVTVSMRILWRLYNRQGLGYTVDELERELRLKHQTCSARVNELRDSGWIVAGETRLTSSRRHADVYRLTARGLEILAEVIREARDRAVAS